MNSVVRALSVATVTMAALLTCVVGCGSQNWQLPDPNDPLNGGPKAADLLRTKMSQASDVVNERVAAKQITSEQGAEILKIQAGEELDRLKNIQIPDSKIWELAEVNITAERWETAQGYLEVAAKYNDEQLKKNPSDQDRWVNDLLRLARVYAAEGHVDKALAAARRAFNAAPHWKWPILYAVYLEIAPTIVRVSPGHELQAGQLVEEAIHQHELAEGSMDNPREKAWVETRNFHIRAAWYIAARYYQMAGKPDLFKQAQTNGDKMPHEVNA